jgi:hypothetical protein
MDFMTVTNKQCSKVECLSLFAGKAGACTWSEVSKGGSWCK